MRLGIPLRWCTLTDVLLASRTRSSTFPLLPSLIIPGSRRPQLGEMLGPALSGMSMISRKRFLRLSDRSREVFRQYSKFD